MLTAFLTGLSVGIGVAALVVTTVSIMSTTRELGDI